MIKISITSISSRGTGEETDVTFLIENGEGKAQRATFTLSSRQYLALGVSRGESDVHAFEDVAHASYVWTATKKGIVILGYGAVSPRGMKTKLISKGFDKTLAEDATRELIAMGLIKPFDDASEIARRCASKLWGKKRIISELYAKGFSSEAVTAALNSLEDEEVDFVQNCFRLIEKRYGEIPADPSGRKKMFAALCRYGYSSGEIKQAIDLYKE